MLSLDHVPGLAARRRPLAPLGTLRAFESLIAPLSRAISVLRRDASNALTALAPTSRTKRPRGAAAGSSLKLA
jgi:hypothetical protein